MVGSYVCRNEIGQDQFVLVSRDRPVAASREDRTYLCDARNHDRTREMRDGQLLSLERVGEGVYRVPPGGKRNSPMKWFKHNRIVSAVLPTPPSPRTTSLTLVTMLHPRPARGLVDSGVCVSAGDSRVECRGSWCGEGPAGSRRLDQRGSVAVRCEMSKDDSGSFRPILLCDLKVRR